jgi:hypothetical protein
VLGTVVAAIDLTDEALVEAAKFTQSVYGVPYADMVEGAKFHALADFFAVNAAMNFAASFYKFAADGATVQGGDLFTHLNVRWQNALAVAQIYLTEAGFVIVAPGAALTPKNYGWRFGNYDTGYLTDEVYPF